MLGRDHTGEEVLDNDLDQDEAAPDELPATREGEALGGWLFDLPPPVRLDAEVVVKAPLLPVWTSSKARLISRYIYFFEMITKHGTYIDGFAGPQSPETQDSWAAEMVLDLKPLWLRHFHLCDNRRAQVRALKTLKGRHPQLDVRVYEGDFNDSVNLILQPGVLLKEATFCLLDQRTFECNWETLDKLARFKTDVESETKIELFYFLAQAWLDRAFSGLRDTGKRQAEEWWGRPDWRQLATMTAWERALAFTERFKHDLGYKSVKPWGIYASDEETGARGRLMYHMIHATDHLEAPKQMARAYSAATKGPSRGRQLLLMDEESSSLDEGRGRRR